jgi:LysR family hydrogen peroxide-inducible transcriptional activator
MTFRELEYLVAVADHGHFGRAARHCHASQSALSLQLQKMEAQLGTQLVERTNRRVVITPTGAAIVDRARHILQSRQELLDDAAIEAGQMPKQVTVGMIPTIAPYRIGKVLATMKKAHPHTSVRIVEDITANLIQAVCRGEVDAAILATAVTDSLLEETALHEDEMLLTLATTHRLANQKEVSPRDIADDPLLLLKDGNCLSDQVVSFCTLKRGPTERHSIAASIETLKALIRAGQGVTLIPRMAMEAYGKDPSLRYVRLNPSPSRLIRIVTRKTSRLGRLLVKALAKTK